jgi:hypothetical protein
VGFTGASFFNQPGVKKGIPYPSGENSMSVRISNHAIARAHVVSALMHIRHEWEEGARGISLIDMDGSVGYILYDFAQLLGLTEEEMRLALGALVGRYPGRLRR